MKVLNNITQRAEWYKGQGIASNSVENPRAMESPFVTQPQAVVKREAAEHDPAFEERQAKLELWMEEVKAFIRNIDVNNL